MVQQRRARRGPDVRYRQQCADPCKPIFAKGVQRGQRIEVNERQISDWTYLRAGKIVGNYTMRPLLQRMPPEEVARYRAMLADP